VNPFDLRGPEFLGFYAAFAAVVLVATWLLRRALDGSSDPPRLSDPYALAFIRGGRDEAWKTALLALHERGALVIDGREATPAQGARFAPGLEAALGARCASNSSWARASSDPGVERALDAVEEDLVARGLLPGPVTRSRRAALCIAAGLLLVGVACTKIAIALSRGRTNVEFLVLLAGVAAFLAWKLSRSRTTRRGDRLVADVRTLLTSRGRNVRRSAHPDPAEWSAVVALLAAVSGPAAVPVASATKRALWPPPPPSASSSGSSCGAFFGTSSCGSSCGGGCGGGGCGGCGSS
jgi:uncharacterized protein (TIGR04222 family)